jgi:hypothetical protein
MIATDLFSIAVYGAKCARCKEEYIRTHEEFVRNPNSKVNICPECRLAVKMMQMRGKVKV